MTISFTDQQKIFGKGVRKKIKEVEGGRGGVVGGKQGASV